jgi:two-component system, OmpR family, copper resistance phosphate regulon response regulator CusR
MCSYRVLIAEDEAKIAAFIQKGLEQAGYVSTVVSSGDAALEAVLNHDFDLVLLDLGLPIMSGEVVLQTLRSQQITCPVLIVTARAPSTQEFKLLQCLANGFVKKPFRMRDLLQRMEQTLQKQ